MLSDTSKLRDISVKMGEFNLREEIQIKAKWSHILDKVRTYKEKNSGGAMNDGDSSAKNRDGGVTLPVDINDSLQQLYGYRLSYTDCSAQLYGSEGNLRGASV